MLDAGWAGVRSLDIRPESRDRFAELMWARFDLAERWAALEDQHGWYREVARQAHARGLSVGMKNGHDQPGSAAVLGDHFGWALPDECVQFDECATLDVFIEQGKAVFAAGPDRLVYIRTCTDVHEGICHAFCVPAGGHRV